MRPIVWLASYPKSGNTWLRLLFASYDGNDDTDLFGALDGYGYASTLWEFDDRAGVDSAELTEEEISLLMPAVFEQRAAEATDQLVLKVHDAYRRNAAGVPRHPAAIAATVYAIRDPRDVAVSFAHHRGATIADTVDRLCDANAMLARGRRRWRPQLPQPLGTWTDHVRSWADEPGLDAHVVRYEDLCRDPIGEFTAILAHIGRTPDPERVRRAVTATTFDRLQRMEAERGFAEVLPSRTAPFFRRGVPNGWRDALTPAQVDRIVAAHGDTMERFGYHTTVAESVA